MGVPVVVPGRAQPVLLVAVRQQVHGLAGQMAALDDHPARTVREDLRGGPPHPRLVGDGDAGELGHLVEVRGGDRGDGQQLRAYGVEGFGGEQGVPVLGDADGVDDDGCAGPREEFRDGVDEGGRGQHAGLHGLDADVVDDAAVLGAHGVHRELPGSLHAQRVLGGDRGQHAHAVGAEGQHRLQVGLDARTAAGV